MKSYITHRAAGELPYNQDAAFELAEQHFWSDSKLQKNFPSLGNYWVGLMAALSGSRLEGYLLNETGKVIGIAVYTRVYDVHYGMVAAPILVVLDLDYRDKPETAKQVVRLIRRMVKQLNATKYLVCKHTSDTTQVHKLRCL